MIVEDPSSSSLLKFMMIVLLKLHHFEVCRAREQANEYRRKSSAEDFMSLHEGC